MGNNTQTKVLSRRDALKLAGTAAAFCASFGFLHREAEAGPQRPGRVKVADPIMQHKIKWERAQIKWFAGDKLLHAGDFPPAVLKHLQSDVNASVQFKFFRAGQLLQTMGKVEAKW
jgi:hypothetical protein